ncbi:hypothetical protein IV102_06810 [bacterium]|nr:hypothetical protein [bacterium]
MRLTIVRTKRGFALMLTLMLTSLMLMMVTAFFYTHQEQLRFQRESEVGTRASQAAQSGLDYARMRLEADPLWGVPLLAHDLTLTIPGLHIFENDTMGSGFAPRSFCCVGVIGDGQSHFQINLWQPGQILVDQSNGRVADDSIQSNPAGPMGSWTTQTLLKSDLSINYLGASTFSPGLIPPLTSPTRALPVKQCLLQIRGVCGKEVRVIEVTIGTDKPTEASFQAGGAMAVDSVGEWRIESVSPGKNRVESGGNLWVSGSPTNTKVKFSGGGDGVSNGAIQAATAGLFSVTDPGDGHLTVAPNGTPTDLSLTPANTNSGGKFKPNTGVPTPPDLSPSTVESLLSSSSYTSKAMAGGTYTFNGPNSIRVNGGTPQNNQLRSIDNTVVAQIENYKLIFKEDLRLDFSGPTTINAQGGVKPNVLMGYDQTGWFLPWDSDGTFLKVQNGNLSVDGSLAGKGSVMTTGNSSTQGSIFMRGKSQMSADPDSAVTLYAERNIKVTPPDPSSAEFFSVDMAAISQAMEAYAPTGAPWNSGVKPLNQFANLSANHQDDHVQGGTAPVNDAAVSGSSIKTAPITNNLGAIKVELGAQFPVLLDATDGPQAVLEFDRMYDMFTTTGDPSITDLGMTTGRYVRLREFLREMQQAHDAGTPLPTSDMLNSAVSPWADVTKNNQQINDQLKAEISYFDRQHWNLGFSSLKNLINHASSENPTANPLTSSMNSRDARWTGLMYARGSVALDTGGGSLDVRGSLISRNEIAVTNVSTVRTVYDPAYVNGLTKFAIGSGLGTKLTLYFYRMR